MTPDESDRIVAQIAATQALTVATTALLFGMSGNDPDLSKAKALLEILQKDSADGLQHLPQHIQDEAAKILSDLCNRVIGSASAHRLPTRSQ